jgi:hypothetical protein
MRGLWLGEPPPQFTYQWLRDGTPIASATESVYTVTLADEGHQLTCLVTATNSAGSSEASASNSLAIAHVALISLPPPQLTPPVTSTVRPPATVVNLGAALVFEVAREQRLAKISVLRRTGDYILPVTAPAPGTLEVTWSEQVKAAHSSTRTAMLVVARSVTAFTRRGTKSVTVRMTAAARAQIAHIKELKLIVKATFLERDGHAVSWQQKVLIW